MSGRSVLSILGGIALLLGIEFCSNLGALVLGGPEHPPSRAPSDTTRPPRERTAPPTLTTRPRRTATPLATKPPSPTPAPEEPVADESEPAPRNPESPDPGAMRLVAEFPRDLPRPTLAKFLRDTDSVILLVTRRGNDVTSFVLPGVDGLPASPRRGTNAWARCLDQYPPGDRAWIDLSAELEWVREMLESRRSTHAVLITGRSISSDIREHAENSDTVALRTRSSYARRLTWSVEPLSDAHPTLKGDSR